VKYRLEIGRSRTFTWPYFLRLAKKFKTYAVANDDGLELHTIETNSTTDLCAVYEYIRGWKGWLFYIDGRPAPRSELAQIYFKWDMGRRGDPLRDWPKSPSPSPDVTWGPDVQLPPEDPPEEPPKKRPWER